MRKSYSFNAIDSVQQLVERDVIGLTPPYEQNSMLMALAWKEKQITTEIDSAEDGSKPNSGSSFFF